VRGLDVLVERYYEPLMTGAADKSSGLLSEHDVNVLLGNLAVVEMRRVNTALLAQLESRLEPWRDHCVFGDVLVRQLMLFRASYSEYYAHFDASNELLAKRLKANDKFRAMCADVQADKSSQRLDLVSFLITPIQRLPRYALLIEQLIGATPADHPDAIALEDAHVVARNLIANINAHMKTRAKLLRVGVELGARGPQPLCRPQRHVIDKFDIRIPAKDDDEKRWSDASLLLLSDLALITQSGKSKFRTAVPLYLCWLKRYDTAAEPEPSALAVPSTPLDALTLELLTIAPANGLLMRCANEKLRDELWTRVTEAIASVLDERVSGDHKAAAVH
jgi:hypothetical protein